MKIRVHHKKKVLASFNRACNMHRGKGHPPPNRTQDLNVPSGALDHCATRPVVSVFSNKEKNYLQLMILKIIFSKKLIASIRYD